MGEQKITPEDWIRQKLASVTGSTHPGKILMAEDTPSHFDSVALQFAFWRMISKGEIKLNRNRSVSLVVKKKTFNKWEE